ncbi:hypothetical protein AYK25_01095 [Thermoplasmatales archaeon SM1-50]|nr:MAG: hypothetical protein AYK25_01095 [Thermoplasmatales archaeon SM1-50]
MMMTAASVCAEDPIARGNPLLDEGATMDYSDHNQGDVEPMLIATGENEEKATNDLPDYENYTGDMLISPGSEADSDAMIPFNLPILGISGAVIVIVIVMIGLIVKGKKK